MHDGRASVTAADVPPNAHKSNLRGERRAVRWLSDAAFGVVGGGADGGGGLRGGGGAGVAVVVVVVLLDLFRSPRLSKRMRSFSLEESTRSNG